jgi:large subunit ribosomal protein L6
MSAAKSFARSGNIEENMSRIGKKSITLPKGVSVSLSGESIVVKGPKGTLSEKLHPLVKLEIEEKEIHVYPVKEHRDAGAFQGTTRALVANMITGVTEGFKKTLAIVGVGYRVALEGGKKLVFSLGFSHPVEFPLPEGITAEIGDKGISFSVMGADKKLLGQTCATIRGFKPPEPYKGKGIRYTTEKVRIKAGKAGSK